MMVKLDVDTNEVIIFALLVLLTATVSYAAHDDCEKKTI